MGVLLVLEVACSDDNGGGDDRRDTRPPTDGGADLADGRGEPAPMDGAGDSGGPTAEDTSERREPPPPVDILVCNANNWSSECDVETLDAASQSLPRLQSCSGPSFSTYRLAAT